MLITPFSVWTPSPVLLEPAFPRLRARPPTPLPPQPPGHLPFPAFALPGGADTPVSPTVGTASSEAKVFSDLCSGEQGPGERGPGAEGRGKAELPGQPVSQSVSQSSASQPVSQSEVKGSFFKGCGLTCLCAAALLPFQRLRQRIAGCIPISACKKVFPPQACSSGPLAKTAPALLGKTLCRDLGPNSRQPRTPALKKNQKRVRERAFPVSMLKAHLTYWRMAETHKLCYQ
eukprot:XP_013962915.1 uncharacterized protein LOC102155390 isoform X1 [Canis lupus familiaris]